MMLGTRDPKRTEVQVWLAKTPGADGGTFSEAARFGDIVVLAVRGLVVERAIELARTANSKHQRKELVSQRYLVAIQAVMGHEEPACQALFDGSRAI